jgi:hypothetical protein
VLAIERQKPKPNLQWNPLLATAAEQYKQAVSQDANTNPFSVIKSVCSYQGNISFNINECETEQDLIELMASMVVGDGDEKKMIRTAIFHPLYREFACSVRKAGNKYMVYTIFAENVVDAVEDTASQGLSGESTGQSGWEDSSAKKTPFNPKNTPENPREQSIKRGK